MNITLIEQSDKIVVLNNLIRPKKIGANSTKIGLNNLKKRFELNGISPFRIEKSQDKFNVIINLRN